MLIVVHTTAETSIFNPVINEVSSGPDLPFVTAYHCIVGPLGQDSDQHLLVAGQAVVAFEKASVLYDESTGEWTTTLPPRAMKRRRMACTKAHGSLGDELVVAAGTETIFNYN